MPTLPSSNAIVPIGADAILRTNASAEMTITRPEVLEQLYRYFGAPDNGGPRSRDAIYAVRILDLLGTNLKFESVLRFATVRGHIAAEEGISLAVGHARHSDEYKAFDISLGVAWERVRRYAANCEQACLDSEAIRLQMLHTT